MIRGCVVLNLEPATRQQVIRQTAWIWPASRLLGLLVVGLALACLALPLVAVGQDAEPQAGQPGGQGNEALKQQLLKIIFPGIRGEVTAREASLDFTKPLVLKGLRVRDPQGLTLLTVEEFALKKTPGQLLWNGRDRGPIKLVRPTAFVSLKDGGCNFIDVMGQWWANEIRGKTLRDLKVEIIEGHLHVIEADQQWQLIVSPLNFSLLPEPARPENRLLRASGRLPLEKVEYALDARYDEAAGQMVFNTIAGQWTPLKLGVQLSGSLQGPLAQAKLALQGSWHIDWQPVTELLQANGQDAELVGEESFPLQIELKLVDLAIDALQPEKAVQQLGNNVAQEVQQQLQLFRGARQQALRQIALLGQPTELQQPQEQQPGLEGGAADQGGPFQGQVPIPAPQMAPRRRQPAPDVQAQPQLQQPEVQDHWLDNLTVQTALGWQLARWGGFEAGPVQCPIQLSEGRLRLGPSKFVVNDGQAKLAASVDLRRRSPVLVVQPGAILEQVLLTPAMCHNALVWIAPIVADSTNVHGRISLALGHGHIPLVAPEAADVGGQLLVHGVYMDLSPAFGDLCRSLSVRPTIRLLEDQVTNFRMTGGRIYHEGFGFLLGENRLYTKGSVGLEGTLDLLADLTLPLSWLPDGPLGRKLKGTRIVIPITGTFHKPSLQIPSAPNLGVNFAQLDLGPNPLTDLIGTIRSRRQASPDSQTTGESRLLPRADLPPTVPPAGRSGSLLERIRMRRLLHRDR